MKSTSWLLIGGPGHGEVHEVFFSTKLWWEHKGRNYLYLPKPYINRTGETYVLAIWQPDLDEVDWLIANRKVPPVVRDNSVPEVQLKAIE